jgi:hypothetical protein
MHLRLFCFFSGIRHGNGEHDGVMQDLKPVYFDAEYSIDGYLARFQGTNQESDGDLLDSLTRDLVSLSTDVSRYAGFLDQC